MVKYLNNFPPFGTVKRLPEDDILELAEFSLPKEWKKELIIQGHESTTQGLTELVEFCDLLKTAEEIFQTQGEVNHQNKKPSSPVNATNSPSRRRAKGHARPRTPQKRTLTKVKQKKLTYVSLAWSWSQYELVRGHVGTIQSREVDLVERLRWRRRPHKVPGR